MREQSSLELAVGGDVLGEDFDGDGAVEAGVTGLVHFAHTAPRRGGLDLARAELCASGQGLATGSARAP